MNCIFYLVPELTVHENYAETQDELPIETIDLSSPESSKESEIYVCYIIMIIFVFLLNS